jgi:putative acetyltransferase
LTARGKKKAQHVHEQANARVHAALDLLTADERRIVQRGMQLYATALERARRRAGYTIRQLKRTDNPAVADLIRTVMPEFGANGAGFAIHDAEVDDMYAAYRNERAAYFVLVSPEAQVVGGAGVAPLVGGGPEVCELRKMYFLPSARGLGFGQTMLEQCLETARRLGFARCYLETLKGMRQARGMYEKNGFVALEHPEGATGHFGCDAWYAKALG